MTYGLIWRACLPDAEDNVAKRFGITTPAKLPVFLPKKLYDLSIADGAVVYELCLSLITEPIILGMLVALGDKDQRIAGMDEGQFVEALKYAARTVYEDERCVDLMLFACKHLRKDHSIEDACMVARAGEKYLNVPNLFVDGDGNG